MRNLILLLLMADMLIAAQCNPGPAPTPPPPPLVVVADAGTEDAGGSGSVVDAGHEPSVTPGVRLACDNLTALKCSEGKAGCYRVMQHVVDTQLVVVPLDCIVAAHSKADVHACGKFVACP